MFEQDIQLARLLLEKCQASRLRRDDLQANLVQQETELDQQLSLRREREGYADLMAKAAALLDRPDLEVRAPDTTELEVRVLELREEVDAVTQQSAQFEELLSELETRAPEIVANARGEVAGPMVSDEQSQTEPGLDDSPEDQAAPVYEQADAEPADEISTATEVESEQEVAEEEPVAEAYDAGNLLKRFNLHALKTKEAFTYGRGAAYVIDASSVLERVPNYDITIRGGEPSAIRDELLRDFDQLSRELSGTFYLVFDSWYHPLVSVGNRVGSIYTTGELEGTRDGARRRVVDLVKELDGKHRNLCVVTSDDELAGRFRNDDLFIISLAEFFNF
jgi:hypothetical protein